MSERLIEREKERASERARVRERARERVRERERTPARERESAEENLVSVAEENEVGVGEVERRLRPGLFAGNLSMTIIYNFGVMIWDIPYTQCVHCVFGSRESSVTWFVRRKYFHLWLWVIIYGFLLKF